MRMVRLIFLILGCVLPQTTMAERAYPTPGTPDYYKKFFGCGPSCLYMFILAAGGKPVSYSEVQTRLPITSMEGTSLSALCEAARSFGLESEMRKFSTDEFGKVPLPAIVHIQSSFGSLAHFDLMYKVDKEGVYLLDGSTAWAYHLSDTQFSHKWTGYALTKKRPSFGLRLVSNWYLLSIILLVTANLALFTRCLFKQ